MVISNDPIVLEREKVNAIIASIDEGIILVDAQGKVTDINHSATLITGFGIGEVQGQPVNKILNLIDKNNKEITIETYCPPGALDIEGVIYKNDAVNLMDKGNVIKEVAIESRKVAGGSNINFGCILKLTDTKKRNELDRMKVDFTSMSVHVLRTPVTIIKGYIFNLLNPQTLGKLDEREIDLLNSALAGVEELQKQVENLLHLSSVQQSEFKVHPIPLNIEGIVTEVAKKLKPKAEAKKLKFLYTKPEREFPMVRADLGKITELITILVENAINYTQTGFIEIKLEINEKNVKVSIIDTGMGINKSEQEQLFTQFYRVKNPLEMRSGAGVGLFIAKQIVDAHNGTISVESAEGRGSTFYFTLPLA